MGSSPKPIVVVKLGGSIITDKSIVGEANLAKIHQLAEEIGELRKKSSVGLVLVHGGGSFSHPPAEKYKTRLGLKIAGSLGMAETIKAGADLNKLVINALIEQGLPAIPVHPPSTIVMSNAKLKGIYLPPLLSLLDNKLLPVTYGDVVTDVELGCADISSDQIVGWVATRLRDHGYDPKMIVHVGSTNGVYDQDGKTIPEINRQNYSIYKKFIQGSEGIDVTGGMSGKVRQALLFAEEGIPTLIISAHRGNLTAAILGGSVDGTWIR